MATAKATNAAKKLAIREEMRERRRAIPAADQRRHGWLLAMRVARQPWFRACSHVALYLPRDGEIDVTPLMRICWRLGKTVYLPRLSAAGVMEFAPYRRGDALDRGKYGLLQPRGSVPAGEVSQLDTVLAPLVAFSPAGERLGLGGGYYDRALAGSRGGPTLLVGVAHRCQQVSELPGEPWDVEMSMVVTETGAVRPPSGKASFSQIRLRPR